MSPKPAILIIHGSFQTPQVYASFLSALSSRGYETHCPQLPSSAPSNLTPDPSNPTYDYDAKDFKPHPTHDQDADCIKQTLHKLIEEESKDVLLIGHSSGGWTAQESALPALQKAPRIQSGKKGGIIGWFGISAFLIQPGESVNGTFAKNAKDADEAAETFSTFHPSSNVITVARPEYWFFHDLAAEEAERWSDGLTASPLLLTPLSNHVYGALPGAYVICEDDRVLPPDFQAGMIKGAEATGGREIKQYRVKGRHEAFLSKEGEIVDAVVDFISKHT